MTQNEAARILGKMGGRAKGSKLDPAHAKKSRLALVKARAAKAANRTATGKRIPKAYRVGGRLGPKEEQS